MSPYGALSPARAPDRQKHFKDNTIYFMPSVGSVMMFIVESILNSWVSWHFKSYLKMSPVTECLIIAIIFFL